MRVNRVRIWGRGTDGVLGVGRVLKFDMNWLNEVDSWQNGKRMLSWNLD